jgi:hypothetical protein
MEKRSDNRSDHCSKTYNLSFPSCVQIVGGGVAKSLDQLAETLHIRLTAPTTLRFDMEAIWELPKLCAALFSNSPDFWQSATKRGTSRASSRAQPSTFWTTFQPIPR